MVGVTGAGAGLDSVWEQEKLEVRNMLENAVRTPPSSARLLGGGVVDESPIYALLANSRLNPIDFLCSRDQFHEASQHLTSHAKSSPSSCPSPTHPPTYPNT